jgi:hypothetical protein
MKKQGCMHMWLYQSLSDYMQCKDMRDNLDQIGIATTTITATTSTEDSVCAKQSNNNRMFCQARA